MKLTAIVIWYNPQKLENCIKGILSYAPYLSRLFIVDNSSKNNSDLAKQIPNSVYIPNMKNLGIAKAKNIGLDKALEAGFDWAITMDHPDRVYASGNIIKLKEWKEVGKFDESLFIDEVDFDFCIRLLLHGYRITRFNYIYLNHSLGNRKFTIFPKCSYHTGKRLFFIIRNKLIENRRYRYAIKLKHDYKKEIYQYFKDYCLLDLKAPLNCFIFIKAYIGYKQFIKNDQTFKNLKAKGLAK